VRSQLEAAIATLCRRHGLTHAALNALAVIEGNGKPMLTGEVGARMHVTSGTVTSLFDNLERKGYVVRSASTDDRRRVMVDITPAAQELLDEILPEVQQLANAIFGPLGEHRLQAFMDTLDRIRAAIAALPAEMPPPAARRRPGRLTRGSKV
jgi:DNA-binding MarR family transcriptional regulator